MQTSAGRNFHYSALILSVLLLPNLFGATPSNVLGFIKICADDFKGSEEEPKQFVFTAQYLLYFERRYLLCFLDFLGLHRRNLGHPPSHQRDAVFIIQLRTCI